MINLQAEIPYFRVEIFNLFGKLFTKPYRSFRKNDCWQTAGYSQILLFTYQITANANISYHMICQVMACSSSFTKVDISFYNVQNGSIKSVVSSYVTWTKIGRKSDILFTNFHLMQEKKVVNCLSHGKRKTTTLTNFRNYILFMPLNNRLLFVSSKLIISSHKHKRWFLM